jgi:uncharacterized protein YjbI with pentapeptide repeats
MPRLKLCLTSLFVLLVALPAMAGELTREAVRDSLARATSNHPADFSRQSLEKLDLSGLNFAGANLAGADLFGAKLVDADFTGANLSGANLNLSWVIHANFTRANLANASLQGLIVSMGLETSAAQAPILAGANLSGAHITARFNYSDARGANFTGASMGADIKNQSMGLMRADLSGARLDGANFSGADLSRALMRFAKLRGANFSGANLQLADLSGADLSGADLTGANVTGADFGGVVLSGAKGLDKMTGRPINAPTP